MILESFESKVRENKTEAISTDLIVAGGGLAGVCTAISAARSGIKVVLVQDRPVLGGNSSSEVRLWVLGATSHMGNNNRWAREGGVIDEILVENLYRNKEGNALIFDTVLLEKVTSENNITLLLNTAVQEVVKKDERTIESVNAFCSQNSTVYKINASLFCDTTGDGIVSYLAGAAFRMGAETKDEFGELFAPDHNYGELLGHTLYFYSKKAERPVKYVPPAFALKNIKDIPRYKNLTQEDYGCRLWWIEFGGRKDTVHETEEIKWELWKVVYGVWDHIKNSGEFEDVDNLTLEWVGTIPGKRESRRFEGHYMIKQQDIVEQKTFDDAVAFGGWAIDLHPADGVYSDLPGCNQWHSKGTYQIPLRCYISRDIDNLFYGGRIISATHVAFGSTRVMATCGHGGQAIGQAAALCIEQSVLPKDILSNDNIKLLQNRLNIDGQSIPKLPIESTGDLVSAAQITASSTLKLSEIPFNGKWMTLNNSSAQMLPLKGGQNYTFIVQAKATKSTTLTCELKTSEKVENFTPEVSLETIQVNLEEGEQEVTLSFSKGLESPQYGFVMFHGNDDVSLMTSETRMTGVLSVFKKVNKAVSNYGTQEPPENIGVDAFEFWTPERRPKGQNIAMTISPALDDFEAENLKNGYTRPFIKSNAWVSELKEQKSTITLEWDSIQTVNEIILYLDTDFDHPMESSLMGHPEDVIPFCVQNITVKSCNGTILGEVKDNHQSIVKINLTESVETEKIVVELGKPQPYVPTSLFKVLVR